MRGASYSPRAALLQPDGTTFPAALQPTDNPRNDGADMQEWSVQSYRTNFISGIHLGIAGCQAKALLRFSTAYHGDYHR